MGTVVRQKTRLSTRAHTFTSSLNTSVEEAMMQGVVAGRSGTKWEPGKDVKVYEILKKRGKNEVRSRLRKRKKLIGK